MGAVVVIGSANADTAVLVGRHPRPGETVLGSAIEIGPGGKGLNQAVASARAGTRTVFVGATGDDAPAAMVREALRECGAEPVLVGSLQPTGTAYVMVSEAGENAIVVTSGANGDQDALDKAVDSGISGIGPTDVVLLQLEIPVQTVQRALQAARSAGATTVLNAAPSVPTDAIALELVDILVVNEHECLALAPDCGELADAARALAGKVGTVIVTLGEEGCLTVTASGTTTLPAFPVTAVDTTAAGDTFCGALCAELAVGAALAEGIDYAMAAAAITVQRHGAASSIPQRTEVEALLATRSVETKNGNNL